MSILKAHLSLNVSNLQKSIEFYSKLFQTQPIRVRQDYAKFDLDQPQLNLALNTRPFTAGYGNLNHLGVQVSSTEDVVLIRSRLQAEGLLTEDEFKTDCCYALQDKIWVTDPDGNGWEFFVVLAADQAVGQTETESCCTPTNVDVKAETCCTPVCC